ncbi:MAG: TRAP transporter substrate-binding protein [Bacteroidetes bacterium]|nr:TRAP transporter substrate-binding protein [Rhodothermia bacterium]MCS7155328.1 TRAP transporter substrate-binding protein [Bacteroidota bacterium]MCX7907579.1 TRAP transporter substrate-binding protein [Bacteroidota bacterium]MDW8138573.1 TRAP transporter substrate-binding protein [Bacteroidota bacterium]MDW8284490.1 TRAP transporter substrate-binding protein [Bacteroidota bacterium]
MKRRAFLALAASGGAAWLAGCRSRSEQTGPAVITQPRISWRLASSFPRGLDTIFGAAEILARRVEALTEGRFRIRVYPAGELVPGLQVLDAVQQGTVQIGHTASYYFTGKNPALAFDTTLPFGLTARQHNAWLYYGGGLELLRAVFADFNILTFPGGNTGAQMGGWFRREIRSATDLRGLKMRIPGLGGEVMSRLGATVQVLAGGDIYPALERGAIDAAEWVGPYDDEKLGFHKVARFYYYPGWWEPSACLSFYVNRSAWDRLPRAYQQAIEVASYEANLAMLAHYDQQNPLALERLRQAGVQLRRFPEDILQAAQRIAFGLYEEQAAREPTYRKLYDAWRRFRELAYRWFGTAERSYADFAFPTPDQAR